MFIRRSYQSPVVLKFLLWNYKRHACPEESFIQCISRRILSIIIVINLIKNQRITKKLFYVNILIFVLIPKIIFPFIISTVITIPWSFNLVITIMGKTGFTVIKQLPVYHPVINIRKFFIVSKNISVIFMIFKVFFPAAICAYVFRNIFIVVPAVTKPVYSQSVYGRCIISKVQNTITFIRLSAIFFNVHRLIYILVIKIITHQTFSISCRRFGSHFTVKYWRSSTPLFFSETNYMSGCIFIFDSKIEHSFFTVTQFNFSQFAITVRLKLCKSLWHLFL